MKLKDKTAIITGGASGIGLETAKLFINEGANVVIADIDAKKGEKAAEQIGANCVYVYMNVRNMNSAAKCVETVKNKFGKIDILINNAGITSDSSLQKMTEEQFDNVIGINLKGVFNMTKAATAVMAENNYGRIINTSSIVGLYGNFGQTNYAASKSGVIGMTKVWARELGKKGITVNAVAPGFIATDMLANVPEKVLNNIKERTPMGRLGTPEDIAKAYLFLASDDAAFITGITLSVDGGLVW